MGISVESYRQRIGLYRNSGQLNFRIDINHGKSPRISVGLFILWTFLLLNNFTSVEHFNISSNVHLDSDILHLYSDSVHLYCNSVHLYSGSVHLYSDSVHLYSDFTLETSLFENSDRQTDRTYLKVSTPDTKNCRRSMS